MYKLLSPGVVRCPDDVLESLSYQNIFMHDIKILIIFMIK